MTHPDGSPEGVDLGFRAPSCSTEFFGSWVCDVDQDVLTWTDNLFELFGFAVHEVVPTFALMSSHQHPQDRVFWDQQVQMVSESGSTASVWHRIIDARMRHRTVNTILQARVDTHGRILQYSGLMTDLTDRLRQDRALATTEAVTRSAQTRGTIDQAKGIIMATMSLDEQAAFDLLRWHSSHLNIKVRDVAAAVLTHRNELTETASPSAPRERLTKFITGLAAARTPTLVAAQSISEPAMEIDPDQEAARTGHISSANLPRTMIRAVAAAGQSISIADYSAPDQPLVYVNQAFEKLTGYLAAEILGRNCRFLQGPTNSGLQPTAVTQLRTAITAGQEIRTVLRNYRKDGTSFWNEVHLSAVRDATGQITHYVGYQTDVSERVHRELQLEHLAFHDARTNLPNHAAAAAHLHQLLTSSQLTTVIPLVGRIHLSGFRGNHGVDDAATVRTVLASAAQRLQAAFPPPAYLAKLEDDTFLLVLTDASSLDAAAQILADPVCLEVGEVSPGVSVETLSVDEITELADFARPQNTSYSHQVTDSAILSTPTD